MDGLNKVMLIGNLGADPSMRYTANGNANTSFNLAVSRSWVTDGDRKEQTEWVTVVTWGKLAELLGQHLQKGRKVYCEGRLATRSWDGPDGQKKYRTEVVASEVIFLDRAKGAEHDGGYGSQRWADHADGLDEPLDPDELPFD